MTVPAIGRTHANIERKIFLLMPNETHKPRYGSRGARLLFGSKFHHWAHRPFVWPFEDRAEKSSRLMRARVRDFGIQVCGPVRPALGHDAGPGKSGAMLVVDRWQQQSVFSRYARPFGVLQRASPQY